MSTLCANVDAECKIDFWNVRSKICVEFKFENTLQFQYSVRHVKVKIQDTEVSHLFMFNPGLEYYYLVMHLYGP